MQRTRQVLMAAALMGLPATAAGQDLIVNGHFHTDINGWMLILGEGTQAWDPLDWEANPASGSLLLTNTHVSPNQVTASGQCFPLTPSGTYEVGGHIRFPSGQADSGAAAIGFAPYTNPTCTDPPLGQLTTPLVFSGTTDTWVESFLAGFTPPAGTVAMGVGPALGKQGAGGSLAALFDRVRFGLDGTTPVEVQAFTVE